MADVPGSSPVADSGSSSASSAAPSSSASAAAVASPASSTPASVSATPADGSSTAVAAQDQQVPFARFKEVNDQLKAAREYQQKYGWASQFESEPYQFVDSWIDQLAQHPQYQQQMYAKAARLLQSRRGQAAPAAAIPEEPVGDVPIVDGHGNVTGRTYSEGQLKKWHEWSWAQREAQLNDRLQPLEQQRQAIQDAQAQAQVEAQSKQHATETLGSLRQAPIFKEHEPHFKAFFAAHDEYGDNVHAAWWDYYHTSVLPTLSQTEQKKVLDTLQTQAAGSTVNPGLTAPTQRPKFKDFAEAARYYDAHPDEAKAMARL